MERIIEREIAMKTNGLHYSQEMKHSLFAENIVLLEDSEGKLNKETFESEEEREECEGE